VNSEHGESPPPSAWVLRFAPLVACGGPVLDVAAGSGRHARWFAARGHPVTAVDRDPSRLAGVPGVHVVAADLEAAAWPFAPAAFACVVVANYLWRPLFPALVAALAEGGVLVYETFMRGHERFGKPTNPDYLLRPGELYEALSGSLQVVAFEQGEVGTPRPAVVQRACAVRTAAPCALDPSPRG
jgi:SAM-dependent methyltransferase